MLRKMTTTVLTPRNVADATEIARLGDDYTGPVEIVAFSPDGALLACSTYDRLYIWDVKHRKLLWERDMPAQSLAFSPDSTVLVVAGRDVIFLVMPAGEQPGALKGYAQRTTCVAFSPDGALLASGGMDGQVRIGNLRTRRLAGQFEHAAQVRALAFSPDGETLATISWDSGHQPKQVSLWDIASGQRRETLPCIREKYLAFSPDGAWLAVDGKVFSLTDPDRRVVHDLNERQIAFSPDGQMMATCHNNFPTIGLWDAASGEKLAVLKGHNDPVLCLAFNAAGTLLASGSGSLGAGAILRGEAEEVESDLSVRLWGVPAAPPQKETPKERRPLKRLGEEDETRDTSPLKPVQDWFNKLSR